MARYVVHVRSPKSQVEAFDYMADLTNFARWDPGVSEATQVEGEGPGPDAAFDVTVSAGPRPLTLRYETTSYDAPERVVVEAKSNLLTSLDAITVKADGEGSIVTYDAELTMKGLLGLVDPLLGLVFNRIGDKAADGLVQALHGEKVDAVGA